MLKKNSIDIQIGDLDSWLAVCGYILPRTEAELLAFDKLHADFEFELTGNELDPDKIWDGIKQIKPTAGKVIDVNFTGLRLAARGLNTIPDSIIEKMRKNQNESKLSE